MAIRVVCPNGHVLRVKDSLAGKTGLCPTCKAPITVPTPEEPAMDESAIMEILGSYDPSASEHVSSSANPFEEERKTTSAKKKMRRCPYCEKPIDARVHVCPYCKHFIGGTGEF